MTYSLKEAAQLLNMGRNTLARQMKDQGILGPDNLPTGRHLGGPHLVVKTTGYYHPILGYTHHGSTQVTEQGLDWLADRLGVAIHYNLPREHGDQPLQKEHRS